MVRALSRIRPQTQSLGSLRQFVSMDERTSLWSVLLIPLLLLAGLLAWNRHTATPVWIAVDSHPPVQMYTHASTVGEMLDENGIQLAPADKIATPRSAQITPNMVLVIKRACPILLRADGEEDRLRIAGGKVGDALQLAGVLLGRGDEVLLNGKPTSTSTPLPRCKPAPDGIPGWPRPPWLRPLQPIRIEVRRSHDLVIHDGAASYPVRTLARTVGKVLEEQHIKLYGKDVVRPALSAPATEGMQIYIHRSVPITIQADGRRWGTRSVARTVGGALAQEGVIVAGEDEVSPPLSSPLEPFQVIRVVRVRTKTEIETNLIPFTTVWVPDDRLEIDHRRLEQKGVPGILKRRYELIYRDGELKKRLLEETWVEREPIKEKLAYGRKIVVHTMTLPDGRVVTYWRKIRMLATSYTAASSGKPRNHPLFGITRLGWRMRRGIVAVDPRVVNLGGRVYVPGYGFGDVADTGGRILGRRIDLGYNESDLVYWYRWVDVYLLTPPPPKSQIPWVLPNWPRER